MKFTSVATSSSFEGGPTFCRCSNHRINFSSYFQSFLLGTWCLSALMDFLLAQAFQFLFDYEVEELPAGL